MLNLFLALFCGVECLLIVKVLVDARFKKYNDKTNKDIVELLRSWRIILVAISIYILREGLNILEITGVITLDKIFPLINTVFLAILSVGLYKYFKELKWSILIPPVK